jgi:hypothetical protein
LLWQIKKLTIAALNKKTQTIQDNKVPEVKDKAEAVLIVEAVPIRVLVVMLASKVDNNKVSRVDAADRKAEWVDNKVDVVTRKAENNQMFPIQTQAAVTLTETVKKSDRKA